MRTRSARATEASAEALGLWQIDQRIDVREKSSLNPIGQAIIRRLGKRAFSCDRAYPSPSPFFFF